MLIERFVLAGIKIISANTDGLLLHITKDTLEKVREIYHEWEAETGFTLEETQVLNYVRRDINNYTLQYLEWNKDKNDYDIKVKKKGLFLPQGGILKGWKFPVISMALNAYYIDGILPEDFISNYTDIYDFCGSQKCDAKFTSYVYTTSTTIETNEVTVISKVKEQKTLRFFVSKPELVDNCIVGKIIKKVEHGATITEKRLVSEAIKIPTRYEVRREENPKTGRMRNVKYKIADRVHIPAVYEKVEVIGDKEISLSPVGAYITLFNDYYPVDDMEEYNIDYQFYIDKCYAEINKIGMLENNDT